MHKGTWTPGFKLREDHKEEDLDAFTRGLNGSLEHCIEGGEGPFFLSKRAGMLTVSIICDDSNTDGLEHFAELRLPGKTPDETARCIVWEQREAVNNWLS